MRVCKVNDYSLVMLYQFSFTKFSVGWLYNGNNGYSTQKIKRKTKYIYWPDEC